MKKILTLSTICVLASSCATIVNDSPQPVSVNTVPSGATVTIDGVRKTSPAVFELKGSNDGYLVTAEKAGYQEGTDRVQSKFRALPVILGNILWLLPGVVIDVVTGEAFELEKSKTVTLDKK